MQWDAYVVLPLLLDRGLRACSDSSKVKSPDQEARDQTQCNRDVWNCLMLDAHDQEAKSKSRSRCWNRRWAKSKHYQKKMSSNWEAHLWSTAIEKLAIRKHTQVDASERRSQGTRDFVHLSGDQLSEERRKYLSRLILVCWGEFVWWGDNLGGESSEQSAILELLAELNV
jgi:hypothetical protein